MCVCVCVCVGIHCLVFRWSVAQEVSEMVVWKREIKSKKNNNNNKKEKPLLYP